MAAMKTANNPCPFKQAQLKRMLAACERMEVEIIPGILPALYFTVACREEWDSDAWRTPAKEIQAQIRTIAARFPNIVCFSLDCYCTLIYIV